MFSCCGFGRKKRKSTSSDSQPNEQTPLLDPNILPFVAAPPPKPFDDEALVEYQRRLDRIIEEAAERIVSVTHSHIPQLHMEASGSGSTASNSPDDDGTGSGHGALPQVGSSAGNDTLWRAEKKTADTSIYSLQKVRKSSNGSRHGKGPAVQNDIVSENDEDQYGTVASYRTASAGGAYEDEEHQEQEEEASYSDDSGNQTPTGLTSNDARSKSRKQDSRRPVQDIWHSDARKPKQKKPLELDKALAMSEADFARLITYE